MSEKIIKNAIIKNITFDDNKFILHTTHGIFSCNIINGSVDCITMDNNNNILSLSCLDIGNNIKIILNNNNIKYIYINTKYLILSDSE
jgi:hypothetical protein